MAAAIPPKISKWFDVFVSIAAAVVIYGALQKLLHSPNADLMLKLGLGVESIIFLGYGLLYLIYPAIDDHEVSPIPFEQLRPRPIQGSDRAQYLGRSELRRDVGRVACEGLANLTRGNSDDLRPERCLERSWKGEAHHLTRRDAAVRVDLVREPDHAIELAELCVHHGAQPLQPFALGSLDGVGRLEHAERVRLHGMGNALPWNRSIS